MENTKRGNEVIERKEEPQTEGGNEKWQVEME